MYVARYKMISTMIYFTAHTINCVCHSIRTMYRVLGIYNFGGWLILFNLLNKWIAKGVAYDPHDFTKQYFFVSHYFAKWKTLFFPVPTPTSKEMNLSKMIK